MLQTDRNWLFNEAYRLDNLKRLWVTKAVMESITVVTERRLEKLRIQEKTGNLVVLFTEAELASLAEDLRNLAANDESRVLHDRTRSYR